MVKSLILAGVVSLVVAGAVSASPTVKAHQRGRVVQSDGPYALQRVKANWEIKGPAGAVTGRLHVKGVPAIEIAIYLGGWDESADPLNPRLILSGVVIDSEDLTIRGQRVTIYAYPVEARTDVHWEGADAPYFSITGDIHYPRCDDDND